ncbi:MAG: VCBS repeat-containing protein [Armatimonadetes bacterium]|nr:VCBS repeat-containing protein [Armatimonadota bacterium]CUU36080.1 hypothetical protein DCOP10_116207 [Armatimonadetes bacterium DC]
MQYSRNSDNDQAKVFQALAKDYLEILATARSVRLLPQHGCVVALVRKTAAARAGEPVYQDPGNVYVVVLEAPPNHPAKRLWQQLVGHGCGGKLVVRDLNRDGKDEIFYWVDGQSCTMGVLLFDSPSKARWLYRNQGRFQAEVRDVNRDGIWEVVESLLTIQLEEPYYTRIASQRCVFARRVWKWDRSQKVYRLWKVEPDWESQRRLSREELRHTPGAKEILRE